MGLGPWLTQALAALVRTYGAAAGVLVGGLAATVIAMHATATGVLVVSGGVSVFAFDFSPIRVADYQADEGADRPRPVSEVVAVIIDRVTGQAETRVEQVETSRRTQALRSEVLESAQRDQATIEQRLREGTGGFGPAREVEVQAPTTGVAVAPPPGVPGMVILPGLLPQAPVGLAIGTPTPVVGAVLGATPVPTRTPTPRPTITPTPVPPAVAAPPPPPAPFVAKPKPAPPPPPAVAEEPPEAPEPEPTPTLLPTLEPTATPTPDELPEFEATPTPTPDVTPTPTLTPTPEPTATPLPTATPIPQFILTTNAPATGFISMSRMAPGNCVTRNIQIANMGDLAFGTYTLTTEAQDGSTALWNNATQGLQMRVRRLTDPTGSIQPATLYQGRIAVSGLNLQRNLAAGQADFLEVRVCLPFTAPNSMQGLSQTVRFIWNATATG